MTERKEGSQDIWTVEEEKCKGWVYTHNHVFIYNQVLVGKSTTKNKFPRFRPISLFMYILPFMMVCVCVLCGGGSVLYVELWGSQMSFILTAMKSRHGSFLVQGLTNTYHSNDYLTNK